jgi:hypothetical protein
LSQNYFNIERCLFRFVSFHTCFSSRHYSNEWWKSKANHHTICISFIFNWISWMQWIQFEVHAMSFNIFNQIEFSFHKMNSFSHHFIINGNAKQCKAQVELCNVQMFYEYVVFWYHFRKNMFIILCAWKILNIIYYWWWLCVHVIHMWTHLCKLCQNIVIKCFCLLGHFYKIYIMFILGRN